ncbi:MAG TPA: protoglobin domain-containing protein [Pseudonocardiaceae bacterium]|jgi:hypothetical protein|nr:protoglobin domain-containing protein [Pseudonocardiaceae bacterium]
MTSEQLAHPERIPGYSYGTPQAARSPLSLDDLDKLKAAVGLTAADEPYLRAAGDVLADKADEMVTAWRAQLAEHPYLAIYSVHPDGNPNPEYSAASKPRFDRRKSDCATPGTRRTGPTTPTPPSTSRCATYSRSPP